MKHIDRKYTMADRVEMYAVALVLAVGIVGVVVMNSWFVVGWVRQVLR